MRLLRHNQNVLVDVEEVVFDLFSRVFMALGIAI